MWADGLTLLQSDRARVIGNRFENNSDVSFISGGERDAVFEDDTFQQATQTVFAGFMMDNFNGGTSGEFAGTVVSRSDRLHDAPVRLRHRDRSPCLVSLAECVATLRARGLSSSRTRGCGSGGDRLAAGIRPARHRWTLIRGTQRARRCASRRPRRRSQHSSTVLLGSVAGDRRSRAASLERSRLAQRESANHIGKGRRQVFASPALKPPVSTR